MYYYPNTQLQMQPQTYDYTMCNNPYPNNWMTMYNDKVENANIVNGAINMLDTLMAMYSNPQQASTVDYSAYNNMNMYNNPQQASAVDYSGYNNMYNNNTVNSNMATNGYNPEQASSVSYGAYNNMTNNNTDNNNTANNNTANTNMPNNNMATNGYNSEQVLAVGYGGYNNMVNAMNMANNNMMANNGYSTDQVLAVGYGGYNNMANTMNMVNNNMMASGYNPGQILPVGYGGYNNMNMMGYNNSPYNNIQYSSNIGSNNPYYNNGGYYNGMYGNFNPYDLQKQQQLQHDQFMQHQQYQSDMMKRLYKSACSYCGREATEEELNFYNINKEPAGPDLSGLTYEQKIEYNRRRNNDIDLAKRQDHVYYLEMLHSQQQYDYTDLQRMYLVNLNVQAFNKERERVPADTDLYTYLKDYAPLEYYEALQNMNKEQRSTSQLYNREDYNALLEKHKSALFGNALNPFASLDDQEITLPPSISDEQRQERRKRFFDSIFMNRSGGNNG